MSSTNVGRSVLPWESARGGTGPTNHMKCNTVQGSYMGNVACVVVHLLGLRQAEEEMQC